MSKIITIRDNLYVRLNNMKSNANESFSDMIQKLFDENKSLSDMTQKLFDENKKLKLDIEEKGKGFFNILNR